MKWPHPEHVRNAVRLLVAGGALVCVVLGLHACRSKKPPAIQDLMVDAKVVFEDSLQAAIADPERAALALGVFRGYEAREEEFLRHAVDVRSRLFELNSNYAASTDDFETLFQELRAARKELGEQLMADFTDLKAHVEPDEWDEVFDAMKELDTSWEALLN